MILRQSYPVVLAAYHLVLAISALIAWWVLCKALRVTDNRGRLAWAITGFTVIEAIAMTPMRGFVQERVGIRDEALNFLVTHTVVVFFLFLGGCVITVGVKRHRGFLYALNILSILSIFVAWISD